MTFANTPSDRATQRNALLMVVAAFVALAVSFCAPALAQEALPSVSAATSVIPDVTTNAPAAAPVDFSLLALFLHADWLVKIVMLGLLAASVWCWAIIIDKSMLYGRANRQMNAFERVFWSGQSLEDLYQQMQERPTMGLGAIFVAAMKEWKRSHEQNAASFLGIQARLEKVLDVAISRESDGLEKRLQFLATVASASPFIGLFGTVWGIMNSFTSIAASKSTNLAVVAPGIAEALFATALGLLAAIPATIAYNKLSADSNKLIGRLESFADEFATILSRQLEARGR
ncbi:MAG TPA: protein TolQ [Devosia sp.]|nr:protein TolQ [Devosia sp.]